MREAIMKAVGKLTVIAIAAFVVAAPAPGADSKTVGKNPGQTKGRSASTTAMARARAWASRSPAAAPAR